MTLEWLIKKMWKILDTEQKKEYTFDNFTKMIIWMFERYTQIRRDQAFDEAWSSLEKTLKQNNLLEN